MGVGWVERLGANNFKQTECYKIEYHTRSLSVSRICCSSCRAGVSVSAGEEQKSFMLLFRSYNRE